MPYQTNVFLAIFGKGKTIHACTHRPGEEIRLRSRLADTHDGRDGLVFQEDLPPEPTATPTKNRPVAAMVAVILDRLTK